MKPETKLIAAAMSGNILEYYDFTLFMFLTPLLSPLFFPSADAMTSLLAGLGTYAAGYIMRPLGSVMFGSIGDRYGRKRALLLSIWLMALPTGLIGLLPTYDQIGLAAPVLLIVCRLCQGLCTGGEYNGASLFTLENVQTKGPGQAGAFIGASSAIGSVLGSGVSVMVTLPFMPSWAWRCAFLSGVMVAAVGLYLRRHVTERSNSQRSKIPPVPLVQALWPHLAAVGYTFALASFCGMMYTLSLRYTAIFLTTFLHWPLSQALRVSMIGTLLYILLIPFSGALADRWGPRKIMATGALATLVGIVPLLWLLSQAHTWVCALIAETLLMILAVWFQSPLNVFMAQLFPSSCRYRGMALGYTLGIAFLGGPTTLIATALTHSLASPLASGLYIMIGALMALVALSKAKLRYSLKPSEEEMTGS